jgi:hypothetical protein
MNFMVFKPIYHFKIECKGNEIILNYCIRTYVLGTEI